MTAAIASLRGFLRGRAGIALGEDKDYLVVSRLGPRLSAWGVPDLAGLAQAVAQQPAGTLAAQVVAALTTNETLFFRDTRPFETLRGIARYAAAGGGLAIWSAACSTGQEVYSIAMTLQDADLPRPCRLTLLASDISEPAVARARRGLYTSFEVQRGLAPAHLARHFLAREDGWEVRPELRANITFRILNLLELPSGLGPFDVVFCRNVLIYFDTDVKSRVLAAIRDRMRPGGWLFLGGAETTMGVTVDFVPVPGANGTYRRR